MPSIPTLGLKRAGNASDINNMRGALWIIASCMGATAMSVVVRMLSNDLPTVQITFLRSALGIWILVPVFLSTIFSSKPVRVGFSRPWLHLLRGALFVLATNCGFYAMSALPLATATTLFFLAPIFATVFSAVFANESVGPRRWAAVVAAFVGAMIILRPGLIAVQPAMLAAVCSAFLFAVGLLITRPLSQADGAVSIMLSSSIIAGITMSLPAWYYWAPLPPGGWWIVAVLVLSSSLRMISDVSAYSIADAGFLAPFAFLRLLFIAAAGWVFFHEGIDMPTLLGAGVIVGSTVFIALREAQLKRREQK